MRLVVTHDGNMATASSVKMYKNGREYGYDWMAPQNGAGEYSGIGMWSVGGQLSVDTRCLDGTIGDMSYWNRVLSPAEVLQEYLNPNCMIEVPGAQPYWAAGLTAVGDIVQPIWNVRQAIGDTAQPIYNVRKAVYDEVMV